MNTDFAVHKKRVWGNAASARTMATSAAALFVVGVLAFLGLASPAGAQSSEHDDPPVVELVSSGEAEEIVEGSYLVMLRSGREAASPAMITAAGFALEHAIPVRSDFGEAIPGFEAELTDEQVAVVARHPDVAYIEPNRRIYPTDVQPDATWGLDRIDQRSATLDDTYEYDLTGDGVDIYIVDSGIRRSHVEFGDRVVGGHSTAGTGPWDEDCTGHGTHVAGIAAGATVGPARDSNIYSVRVFDCAGSSASLAQIVEALGWIADRAEGPSVVNLSLGGYGFSQAESDAVAALLRRNVVVVAAVGNDDEDACQFTPSSYAGVLSVGAVDRGDRRSIFSGERASNWGRCVDLFAPGGRVYSAWPTGSASYMYKSGTSMAAPFATGVAALFLEAEPNARP